MNQQTVMDALRRIGAARRFFAPEFADLLWMGRHLFHRTFGPIAVVTSVPWFDLVAMQTPVDFMAYAECIALKRPRVVVETGTAAGAGALFYAEALRRVHGDGNFRVVTVERFPKQISLDLGVCPQITQVIGDSVDPEVVKKVYGLATEVPGPVMVTLDSDHSAVHAGSECGAYADLVSPGQYMIVQDTYLGLYYGGNLYPEQGRAILEGRGGGLKFDYIGSPLGGVEAFLSCDDRFRVDMHPQRWMLTQCPFGFLLKDR